MNPNFTYASYLMSSLSIILLLYTSPGFSETENEPVGLLGDDAFLINLNELSVEIIDEVKDGCLPRPKAIETTTKAALTRNGFNVVDDGLFVNKLFVSAIGGGFAGGCVVNHKVNLIVYASARIPNSNKNTWLYHTINVVSGLLTGDKATMQRRIQDYSSDAIDELLLLVTKASNSVKNNYPRLHSEIETNKHRTMEGINEK